MGGGDLNRKVATSVADYVEIVAGLVPAASTTLWFRGHSDSDWMLLPGVLRDVDALTDGLLRPVPPDSVVNAGGHLVTGLNPERMLAAFKQRARPFLREAPANDFEWMFIAQHHGLPTRLLDWSTNALVALFFAAEHAAPSSQDPAEACEQFLADEGQPEGFAVFAVDPAELNGYAHDLSSPVDIAAAPERWQSYLDPMNAGLEAALPVCVTAPHGSDRIRAQSGVFTLHGSQIGAIDYYSVLRPMLTKIFIPGALVAAFRQSLARLGLTRAFVYPGLDSLAADIRQEERLVFDLAQSRR